jgi:hypothetical protein
MITTIKVIIEIRQKIKRHSNPPRLNFDIITHLKYNVNKLKDDLKSRCEQIGQKRAQIGHF